MQLWGLNCGARFPAFCPVGWKQVGFENISKPDAYLADGEEIKEQCGGFGSEQVDRQGHAQYCDMYSTSYKNFLFQILAI